MFNIIFKSATSITIEMDNSDIYYTNPYDVRLNGE